VNIIIDARLILNNNTGIGSYLIHLIEALLEIDQKNHYVIFIDKKLRESHPVSLWEQENLHKEKVAVPAVRPGQQLVIPFKLNGKNVDIYHYPHFDLPLLQNNDSVITIHDLKYIIAPGFFPEFSLIKKKYMNFFYRLAGRRARKIIVVSESTRNDLIKLFKIPGEKIAVIPLAASGEFRPAKNKESIDMKLTERGINNKYFLVIGERRPHKNLVRIIEAFSIFKERCKEKYNLVLVGKKYANYSEPEQKITALNLNNDVILAGYVSDDWLPIYYQGAEALIFTSLYEGFGIPIAEAMACGTPVITSNISSMPEVAGNAALYVDPYDSEAIAEKMELLVKNMVLSKELKQKGVKQAKKFNWHRTAEQTLSVYEEVYRNGAKAQN